MRHIFIINPAAGKKRRALEFVSQIEACVQERNVQDYRIYYTKAPKDATEIARREASSGSPVRFYACGGDGTLNETLAGMYNFKNAQLTHCPCGSANDYVRMFPEKDFMDIAALIDGIAEPVDILKCGEDICLNICCMGMDADVANKMVRYKNLPFVSGSAAYLLAIVDVFFHKIGKELCVRIETEDGVIERNGKYFVALAANGQFYGGGFRGAPNACPQDGLLDFVLIRKISRLRIPSFLARYKNGQPLSARIREDFRGRRMTVSCGTDAIVCSDGECVLSSNADFEILPGAVSFVFPCEKTEARQRRAPVFTEQ